MAACLTARSKNFKNQLYSELVLSNGPEKITVPISVVIEGFCDTDGNSRKSNDCDPHNINLSPSGDSPLLPYHGRFLSREKNAQSVH